MENICLVVVKLMERLFAQHCVCTDNPESVVRVLPLSIVYIKGDICCVEPYFSTVK